ncbi:LysR family transcriptional regulator [Clostridium tetani]|uniref:LysR family transcriptional regulator n=1 Tax=Clostridium tetani TaxID=1513 RepID=A0ABY0ES64_CLOTA|nr:LysR family transcriptional regulator [Clostridium tetani]CDI48194.1 transcriptional regulatory protein [Clostridium tetani 12124569]KHO40460.1 LysR family transcriptional regulator [Clostridium tetani]RXI40584.1 LysR family transcriptional regulator [Clostridium tetani]RXI58280.1 LysR family transcriptional regulator [Clostridium tetani]RXI70592.1 LysR family transcriptional regulator [Clostridium tetani]
MSIKLDLYKIFSEVAKHKSFSKAAKSLYMTQPAVSQAIMQLENELEIRLFTRTHRGVILTNEGELLFEYTSSAINLINVAEKKLIESKNLLMGDLKLGVGDTISRYFLLPYLEKFHSSYPNIKLKIINRTTLELCIMLKSGEIDIAICNLPINDPSLEVTELTDIHDIFVCGKKYKDKISTYISLKELSKFPLILLESKSNSRQYVEKYMLSKGITITPEIELGSHDLLLEFAKINLGISCVIKEFSQDYLISKELYEIQTNEAIPKRNIGVCFLKSVSLSPSSTRFVDILKK